MSIIDPQARHRSRELLLQALYQWQLTQNEVTEVERQFEEYASMSSADKDYFQNCLYAITKQADALDQLFSPFLDRPMKDLNPVELSILRLACYELQERFDVPYKVVINEALELAKSYGSEDGFKFVNAVLDKVALQTRAQEIK